MPGEPGEKILGALIAKIVEQQERIELLRISKAKRPPELDARSLDGGLGLDDTLDRSDRHVCSFSGTAYQRREGAFGSYGVTIVARFT
jgi:hypothetical protein